MTVRRRSLSPVVMTVCLLWAGAINFGAVAGLSALVEVEPREREEQVSYIELTPDVPKDPELAKVVPPKAENVEKEKPEPPKAPEPEPESIDEPLPEPEPEPEPDPEVEAEPEPEEPPPPFEFVLNQLKMVEQPDEKDEEDAPEDVEYLSNINRDVDEQTRAEITNLEQDSVETEASELEPSDVKDKGTADEDVIAEDADKESQLAKQAPDVQPEKVEQRPEQNDPEPQALQLAMRELEARDHQAAAEAHEALTDDALDGSMRPDQDHQATLDKQDQQARIDKQDKRYAFKMTGKQLDALYGESVDAPRRAEHLKQSKKKGVWEEANAHWQSPLENMIPEVKVGNQTALRSKKHPFARYITKIHRSIHEAWAWGFLEQLDTRGRNHELNDYELWTRVELVLTRDGVIDNVMTVHHSGSLVFDAAAREIVHSIGPFPNPPREILSGNGKVYIHWAFHRNERACGTYGAQPFILDNAGEGDRPDPDMEVQLGTAPPAGGRRLERGGSHAGHNHGPARPVAPNVAQGPALPPGVGGNPGVGRTPSVAPPKPGAQGGGGAALPLTKPTTRPAAAALASDPAAQRAAHAWLDDLVQGRLDKLAARSTLPFYSGSTMVARTKEERADVLQSLSEEARVDGGKRAAKYTKPDVLTAAKLRKVFGSVPSGVQEGDGYVYALTKVRGDFLILILQKKFGAWRIVGTTR